MIAMEAPVVPNYRETDLTEGERTMINLHPEEKGLQNDKPLLRFAKLFLFPVVLVAGYFLLDALVVNPPIETLGSKSDIEQRYQQMMHYRLPVQDPDQ